MPTKTTISNTATTAEIQSAVDSYDVVEFAAGQVFQLTGYLSIKKPTKIFSSTANPATIRKAVGNRRAFLINSSDVLMSQLRLDFNLSSGWEGFSSLVTFDIPNGDGQTQNALARTKLYGLDFIDSAGEVERSGSGDVWGIVWTNAATSGVQNAEVIGCRMLATNRQLTAGGAGGGVNGCEIAYCYVNQGQSNAISVSNRFNDGTEDDDALSSINIHHNVIIGYHGSGIFVGRDGNDDPDLDVSVSNITIADNYIEARPTGAAFPRGILVKSGTSALSTWSNVSVLRNKIVHSLSNSSGTRIVDLKGPSGGGAVTIANNDCTGPAAHNLDNLTITQSGNTNNNSPITFTSS